MAKQIAGYLGDTDIVLMRSFPEKTDATEAKRVGFIFPCYGGGLPGHVEEYVRAIKIAPGAFRFAVEQFAGYMGCGLHKIDEIVGLDYWNLISNHSTYIWLQGGRCDAMWIKTNRGKSFAGGRFPCSVRRFKRTSSS